jgi:hypothetical protein
MRKSALIGSMAALLLGNSHALAGPWEDGMVAYNRGDYVPAIRLFRPLAEAGNPKAQTQGQAMAEACAASNYRACEY